MRFAVVREVKAGGKTFRRVRLVLDNVPEGTKAEVVMDALTKAGRTGATSPAGKTGEFQEAGIPWGNHTVKSAASLPAGTEGLDEAPVESWTEIADSREIRRVTLRLEAGTYDRVSQAAARHNKKLQRWFEEVIEAALSADEMPTPAPVRKGTKK